MYLSVPIAREHRKYLRIYLDVSIHFTKLLHPVKAHLRSDGLFMEARPQVSDIPRQLASDGSRIGLPDTQGSSGDGPTGRVEVHGKLGEVVIVYNSRKNSVFKLSKCLLALPFKLFEHTRFDIRFSPIMILAEYVPPRPGELYCGRGISADSDISQVEALSWYVQDGTMGPETVCNTPVYHTTEPPVVLVCQLATRPRCHGDRHISTQLETSAGVCIFPLSLTERCVQKVREEKNTLMLVTLLWQAQTWFPGLLEPMVDYHYIYPRGKIF